MPRDVSGSPWKRQINGVGLNVHNDKCCCNAGNFPDPPSKPLVADILPYQLVEQNPTEKRWALIIGLQCRILIGNPQKMGAGGESVLALMGQELSTCASEDPVMQPGKGLSCHTCPEPRVRVCTPWRQNTCKWFCTTAGEREGGKSKLASTLMRKAVETPWSGVETDLILPHPQAESGPNLQQRVGCLHHSSQVGMGSGGIRSGT